MFNSSPIEAWEGAGVFFTFGANSGMTHFWFWIAVLLCIVPLFVTLKTENQHENMHQSGGPSDSDHTAGVER